MRAWLLLALLAGGCGLTQQTQRGREADLRAESHELEASERRRVLASPDDIEPFLIAYAGTDAARRELIARQVDLQDTQGCAAAASFLQRIEEGVTAEQGKPLALEANVRRAELLLGEECNDPQAAVDAARLAVGRAQKTQWADDADWVMGRACEKAGKNDEALAAYGRIVKTMSSAIPFGSNDSLFLDDAWLAKGLLLEKLGRYGEARDTLRDLLDARDTHLRPKAMQALDRMAGK